MCLSLDPCSFCVLSGSVSSCPADGYSEALKIELLQLGTLLMQKIPANLIENRPQLIKFGWGLLKRDDSTCKYYAFVNVAHFLEAYEAPEKIALQVSGLNLHL